MQKHLCQFYHYKLEKDYNRLIALIVDDDDEDDVSSSETLISRSLLSDLCGESAKLKSMGVTNQVSTNDMLKY